MVGGVTDAVGGFYCSKGNVNLMVRGLKVQRDLRHVLSCKLDGKVPCGEYFIEGNLVYYRHRLKFSSNILKLNVLCPSVFCKNHRILR